MTGCCQCPTDELSKLSICFVVDKTTFRSDEMITVRCAAMNCTDKPLTILTPFGDPFYSHSAGITILGPSGAVRYGGAIKEYLLVPSQPYHFRCTGRAIVSGLEHVGSDPRSSLEISIPQEP